MESRFSKPNPSIQKKVIKARQNIKRARRAQSIVVGISMTLTALAGLFFAAQDAQVASVADTANNDAMVTTVQQDTSATPSPLITTIDTTTQGSTGEGSH